MTQTHTPTPYHRNIKPATKYTTIWSGRNEHIAYMATEGRDPEQVEKDMDFIVRACNFHESAVSALKTARDRIRCLDGNTSGIDALLKQVEGE